MLLLLLLLHCCCNVITVLHILFCLSFLFYIWTFLQSSKSNFVVLHNACLAMTIKIFIFWFVVLLATRCQGNNSEFKRVSLDFIGGKSYCKYRMFLHLVISYWITAVVNPKKIKNHPKKKFCQRVLVEWQIEGCCKFSLYEQTGYICLHRCNINQAYRKFSLLPKSAPGMTSSAFNPNICYTTRKAFSLLMITNLSLCGAAVFPRSTTPSCLSGRKIVTLLRSCFACLCVCVFVYLWVCVFVYLWVWPLPALSW